MRTFATVLLLAACAVAQAPQREARDASVTGMVRYAGYMAPVPEAVVFADGVDPVPTDKNGRYTIPNLPPGTYVFTVLKNGSTTQSRKIVVNGLDLTGIDINFRMNGAIAGRVLDEQREPVAGAVVSAVVRVYSLGELQSRRIAWAATDRRGAYRIANIPTGEPVLLLATRLAETIAAISDVPEDLKERKEVLADSYYPNTAIFESALPLMLRPGQTLSQIDIRMATTRGYCAEGVMPAANNTAVKLDFLLTRTEAVFARTDAFGATGSPAPDGRFRICNLAPGQYRLTTQGPAPKVRSDFTFGITPFTVVDRDVTRLQVVTPPLVELPGELMWDASGGPTSGSAGSPHVTVRAVPVDRRAITIGEWNEMQGVSAAAPGAFRFPGMLMGNYEVSVLGLPSGYYVKDVNYGGVSVLHRPLRLGDALPNSSLGVVIARDGAVIAAQVSDGDGKPVIDAHFYALPAAATTEAELAETLAWGQTDRFGQFTTDTLPPGKYYVLAVRSGIGLSAHAIGRLWMARLSQGTELELGRGGFRQVRLAPVEVR